MADIYMKRFNGGIFEIENWALRDPKKDALVGRTLSSSEEAVYEQLKNQGKSDSQIWLALHPSGHAVLQEPAPLKKAPAAAGRIQLKLRTLTKKQMIELAEECLDVPLPSMKRMTRRDIEAVLTGLMQDREIILGL